MSVGNFYIVKRNKCLSKQQLAQLRKNNGLPEEVKKDLKRAGLPYIKISSVSENWCMEISCNMDMFKFIDGQDVYGFNNVEVQNKLQIGCFTETSKDALLSLARMLYCDCTILGDNQYWKEKANILDEYAKRAIAAKKEETPEEKAKDDEILKAEEAKFNAKNNAGEMAKTVDMNGKEVHND